MPAPTYRKSYRTRMSLLCIALCALAACGDSELRAAEKQFVAGCNSSGVPESVCVCVFDKMKDHYGRDRIVTFDTDGVPPDYLEFVANAAATCR
jgi:hypothetical protein